MKSGLASKLARCALAAVLAAGLCPAAALATPAPSADDPAFAMQQVVSGTCGANATWTLDTATGALSVDGTGDMYGGGRMYSAWMQYDGVVSSVSISAGITGSENSENSFISCSSAIASYSVAPGNAAFRTDGRALFSADGKTLIAYANASGADYAVPAGVTSIGGIAFANCSSLRSVSMPAGVISIGYNAFQQCTSLASVSLPDGVTSIDRAAFVGCASLADITIPVSVTSVGQAAFSGCDALKTVTFKGNAPSFDYHAGSDSSKAFAGDVLTAYYPAGNPTWTAEAMAAAGGAITWESYVPSAVDTAALSAAIASAEAVSRGVYTQASWDAFQTALASAKAQLANPGTQAEVDAAAAALAAAQGALTRADAKQFPDVTDPVGQWFYDSVYRAADLGLFSGYADGNFGPWDPLTRGQFAVVLWRWLEPEEAAAYDGHAANATGMPDVADDAFYTGAVNWAVQKGYITGYAATGTFGPNDKLSAEMLCVILCRIQGGSGDAASLPSRIADADQVSTWARSGCAWALENGVLSGYQNDDGTRSLRTGEDIFRGRAATILVNAIDGGVL